MPLKRVIQKRPEAFAPPPDPTQLVPAYFACKAARLVRAGAEIRKALIAQCGIDPEGPPRPVESCS
jgi:hypothetical protein